ncbi:L-fucose isomerase [Bacteroidales bacterium Barb6XT]|nr:L-fucose isomerase [Bacteroidales bacterium Barb6XT]
MNANIVFLPLARTTFSMPDAEDKFRKSCLLLESLIRNFHRPQTLLTSPEMLSDFVNTIGCPDLIIYQCTTFIGGDFITELTRRFECPVIIWSLREPSINGGRLKLNSLTGAFSAANSLYMQCRDYLFILGNPDEPAVIRSFKQTLSALDVTKKLQELVIGVVGSQPPGFGFGAIDEALLVGKLGVRVAKVEVANIIKAAAAYPPETFVASLAELKEKTASWELIPAENLEKHARLHTAYREFVATNGIKAIASRCWPDFFTEYGVPVCSVLSLLNDNGIAASCETDMGGAISMFIGSALTGSAAYFGDPVAVDETCNGIVFWHCGAGALSLAREKEGAKLGVHPNRKTGPTMEFGLKSGVITILRLGKTVNGFRLMAMKGKALDEPQKFLGTSVTVQPEKGEASEKVAEWVRGGWEPHFVVAYGDILEELRLMSRFLNLEFLEY